MTIDQYRCAMHARADHYAELARKAEGNQKIHYLAKADATREAAQSSELVDGIEHCPACGSRFGSRLQDGRWQCNGLSSYAVLPSELCGHICETEESP